MISRYSLIVVCLLAFCLSGKLALGSEEVREPWWRFDESSGGWCFLITPRRACLPASFWLKEFEPGHAAWIDDDREYMSLFLEYDDASPLGPGDDDLPGEEFRVLSTAQTGGVVITELVSNESQPHAHAATVFVLEFEEGFSLMLFGVDRDTDVMRDIARSIVEDWLAPRP